MIDVIANVKYPHVTKPSKGQWHQTVMDVVLCTYELSKASDRQPTGSCYKLKKTDSLLVVHLFHHLQGHNSIIH